MTGINFANLFQQGGPFDIGGSFAQGYSQGQQLRQQQIVQNALGEISRRAQAGDLQGAASIALQIGDTQTANTLLTQQRQREIDRLAAQKQAQGEVREVGGRLVRVTPEGKTSVLYEPPLDPFLQALQGGAAPQGAGAPPPPPTAATPTMTAQPTPAAPQGRFGPRVQPAPGLYAPSTVAGGKGELGRVGPGGYAPPAPQPVAARPAPQMPPPQAAAAAPQRSLAGMPPEIRQQAIDLARMGNLAESKKVVADWITGKTTAPGGPQPLEKATKAKLEQGILNDREGLRRLDSIKSYLDPSFLTYWGQAQRGVYSAFEKAGGTLSPETSQYIGQFRKFRNEVGQAFNIYRKDITGAGASIGELNRLKETFLNQDLSPSEFTAAFQDYEDQLKRSLRLKNAMLRQGIDPKTEAGGKTYDDAFLSGADDDFQSRLNELQQSGMSEDQAFEQLKSEGYQ